MTLIYQLSLSLFLLFSAPKNIGVILADQSTTPSKNTVFITDWESSTSWKESNNASVKQFFLKRQFAQLTNEVLQNGLVLVYSKGYNFTETNFIEKPLSLPFYFFSSDAESNKACHWVITNTYGEVELGLSIPDTMIKAFHQKKNDIQFRYIIIDEAFLKQYKLSKIGLQNMSYNQVIKLINATP